MKRIEAHRLDSLSDYQLVEGPTPAPGPGQVLIRMEACGVGYVDALVALGRYQVKPPLPHTPGSEIGGVVEALGEGVAGLVPGRRVMAQTAGGFAEYVVAPASTVIPVPDAMTFEQAAGFRINYLTAIHGLVDRAGIRPGERLLVMGAAGGVGMAAVQVGVLLGAHVIACASTPEKRAFALAHGAHETIDTDAMDPKAWRDRLKALCDGGGPDVIFDPVCGRLFEPAFRALAWKGRHLVVGFVGGPIPALPANLTLMKGAALTGVDVRQFQLFERARTSEHLDQLMAWVADGRLSPPVGRAFAFEAFGDAMTSALSGQGLGKSVLLGPG